MSDGIDFVPIAMGLFGIAEIISNLEQRTHAHGVTPISSLWPSREARSGSSRWREGRSPVGPIWAVVPTRKSLPRMSAAAPMPMNTRPDQKYFEIRTALGIACLSILAGNVPAACAVASGFPAGFSHDQRILELDVTAGRMRQRRLDGDHHSGL
jgi:TctA family transporter